jgi:hypothetical protein
MPAGSTWDHVLTMGYPYTATRSCSRPAARTASTPTRLRSRWAHEIQLDPAFDVDGSDLPEWQEQLCRTLQKYGIVVADTGSALMNEGLYSVRFYGNYTWPWEPGWAGLPASVVSRMRVLG